MVVRGGVLRLVGHLRAPSIAGPDGRGRRKGVRVVAGHGVAAREGIEGVLGGGDVPPAAGVVVVAPLLELLLGARVGDVHGPRPGRNRRGLLVEVPLGVVEARVGGVVGEGSVGVRAGRALV